MTHDEEHVVPQCYREPIPERPAPHAYPINVLFAEIERLKARLDYLERYARLDTPDTRCETSRSVVGVASTVDMYNNRLRER